MNDIRHPHRNIRWAMPKAKPRLRGAIIAVALLVAGAAQALPLYSVIDLGVLRGGESSATAISSSGQVVGDGYGEGTILFSGTGTGNTDLGSLGGGGSRASGINNAGQVAILFS